MTITTFDKPATRNLRDEINKALEDVGTRLGITLHAGNATMYGNTVTFKLEGAIIASDGNVMTKERSALEALFPQYLDKQVMVDDEVGTVTGYRRKAKKYPFIIDMGNGKTWVVPESHIKANLR